MRKLMRFLMLTISITFCIELSAQNSDIWENMSFVKDEYGNLKLISDSLKWQMKDEIVDVIEDDLVHIKFFNDSIGWIVGSRGLILKTQNGGKSWLPQLSNVITNLYEISIADEKTAWILGENGIFLRTKDGGKNWTSSRFDGNNNLRAINICSKNTVFILRGYSYISKTTDGGESWITYDVKNYGTINSFYFTSKDTGWFETTTGKFYKTLNGGENCIEVLRDSCSSFEKDILYYKLNKMFSYEVTTIDSFITIESRDTTLLPVYMRSDNKFKYSKRYPINEFVGWRISWFTMIDSGKLIDYSQVYFTNDGGKTWSKKSFKSNLLIASDKKPISISCIYFLNKKTGFAVGSKGTIYKSLDGGINWKQHTYKPTEGAKLYTYKLPGISLNKIYFMNSNTGWIIGSNGLILKTVNAGESWSTQTSGTKSELKDIFFVNHDTGWIVGGIGLVMKTINSGITWQVNEIDKYCYLNSINFFNNKYGIILGSSNTFRTIDSGETWNSLPKTSLGVNRVYFVGPVNLFAVGNCCIFKLKINNFLNNTKTSFDDIWDKKINNGFFKSIFFVNNSTGWAVGKNGWSEGIIFKSIDGGEHWNRQAKDNKLSSEFSGVYFNDVNNGWSVGINGEIIKTTNGGELWELQNNYSGFRFNFISFSDNYTGWIVGENGCIMKYSVAKKNKNDK